jgi:hypothetical protein
MRGGQYLIVVSASKLEYTVFRFGCADHNMMRITKGIVSLYEIAMSYFISSLPLFERRPQ